MAVVSGVMAASIFAGSRFKYSGSISTKIGFILFHHKECVVATKLNGVVITSPVMFNACRAVIKANVPFENNEIYFTPKVISQFFFELLMQWTVVCQPFILPYLLEIGYKLLQWWKTGLSDCNWFYHLFIMIGALFFFLFEIFFCKDKYFFCILRVGLFNLFR